MIEEVKIGLSALFAVAIFAAGWHVGALRSKTALEADHAAMAQAATSALLAQASASDAQTARLNKVISDYENTPPDPVAAGIVHRVYLHEAALHCDSVPKAAPHPAGTRDAGEEPAGPDPIERAAQQYSEACAADAAQLNALIAAWPQ